MKVSRVFNISLIIFPLFTLISVYLSNVALTITFATITFHFWLRAICGAIFSTIKLTGKERIFNVSDKELKLYEKLGVKNWKDKLPTYKPEIFKEKDFNKLYSNMLHSEFVHIAISIFSYTPLLFSIFWSYLHDSIIIFFITSVLASLLDMTFVIAKRYNRPKVKHLMSLIVEKHQKSTCKNN